MIESNKQAIGRGAVYIYIQYFISAISGYIFWLILTQLTSSSIVGTLSAIIAIGDVLASFAIIGIPDSIQRYLGKVFYEKNIASARTYLAASLILVTLGIFATSLFIIFDNTLFSLSKINYNLKLLIIAIVTSSAINLLLTSVVISSLKTRVLPTVNIISSSSKIVLSIILVLSGSGVVGISLSYLVFGNVLSAILLTIYSISLFRPTSKVQTKSSIGLRHASSDLLAGGVASWIPMIVMNVGIQLGTIVLFGSKGSDDTAIYFISLTIVNALLVGTISLTTIGLPVLSALQDGRKRIAWQMIRWGFLISVPLASAIFFYSREVLNLLGQNYVEGETALQILLLSIPPTIIHSGISNLIYSYGNYKQSIAFDSTMGIPRIILYFILVPIYGSIGASISFTVGSLAGLIISIIVARKMGMLIFWKDLALVLIIPIIMGYILHRIEINLVFGIIATIIFSYISLLKLKVITKSDVKDIMEILPVSMSNQLSKFLGKINRDD
jgi:O-antigen/teichoic acid export membrane protein